MKTTGASGTDRARRLQLPRRLTYALSGVLLTSALGCGMAKVPMDGSDIDRRGVDRSGAIDRPLADGTGTDGSGADGTADQGRAGDRGGDAADGADAMAELYVCIPDGTVAMPNCPRDPMYDTMPSCPAGCEPAFA